MIDDKELVEGCAKKERLFQKKLYDTYARKMLSVCLCYTRDRYEAENILQESFIKIFENIANFRMTGSLEGWIRRIVVNTALDHYRKWKRINFNEVEIEHADDETINTDIIDRMSTKEIVNLIQTLPEGSRLVFTLYAVEGYTHPEIGKKLGISVGTSKSQYSRARRILMDKILKVNENLQFKRVAEREI